jgi:hypothetical protein
VLHRTGAWYLWFAFALTFIPDPERGWDAVHALAIAAFVAAPFVRAVALLKTRRGHAAAPA